MPKLSDLQASLLLEEIACVMRIGAPMDEAMRRLQTRRLGVVGTTAGAIADGVAQGRSVSDALRQVDPNGQAAAAVEACERGSDPGLLEEIAFQFRRRAHVQSESRLAWFYPWVLLAVGYLVAVLVMAPLVRRLHGTGWQWPDWVVTLASWLETGWWVPLLVVIVVIAAFVSLFWRRSKYRKPIRLSLFCAALAEQIAHEVPEAEAIALASDFSAEATLKSNKDLRLLSPSVMAVVDLGSDWQRMVQQGDQLSIVAALRYRARVYEDEARRRDFVWTRVLPQVVMVLIGAGLTLSYVVWVIAPVYRQVATW